MCVIADQLDGTAVDNPEDSLVEITHKDLEEKTQESEKSDQDIKKEIEVIGEARNETMSEIVTEIDPEGTRVEERSHIETPPTQLTGIAVTMG